uniref:Uncharacterized protein n=1 Tax=Amphimedon queenslandica TaxID=400682 RepID=A0A1X7U5H1_AMPQE
YHSLSLSLSLSLSSLLYLFDLFFKLLYFLFCRLDVLWIDVCMSQLEVVYRKERLILRGGDHSVRSFSKIIKLEEKRKGNDGVKTTSLLDVGIYGDYAIYM